MLNRKPNTLQTFAFYHLVDRHKLVLVIMTFLNQLTICSALIFFKASDTSFLASFYKSYNSVIPRIMTIAQMLYLKLLQTPWEYHSIYSVKRIRQQHYTLSFKILQRFEPYVYQLRCWEIQVNIQPVGGHIHFTCFPSL